MSRPDKRTREAMRRAAALREVEAYSTTPERRVAAFAPESERAAWKHGASAVAKAERRNNAILRDCGRDTVERWKPRKGNKRYHGATTGLAVHKGGSPNWWRKMAKRNGA